MPATSSPRPSPRRSPRRSRPCGPTGTTGRSRAGLKSSRRSARSALRWAGSGAGLAMTDSGGKGGAAHGPALDRGKREGVVETACKVASALALVLLLGVVAVDIVTRWGFNFSYEISDEIGAYMLVAIAFLSLPVS